MGQGGSLIRAERVDRGIPPPDPVTDPEVLAGFLEDASGTAGGRAAGLVRVRGEAEAAALLRSTTGRGLPVIAQGARSSLTGGAVPRGELVLALEGLDRVREIRTEGAEGVAVVEPGATIESLQEAARERGLDYPGGPTHRAASVGGTVATNAGGPATFRHGVTRDWVRRVRGILAGGDVIDVRRGEAVAGPGGSFEIETTDGGRRQVPVPVAYRTPPLKKVSAGYFVAEETDLVDLLVGSEGTLAVFTEIEVRLVARPAAEISGVVFLEEEAAALALAGDLRRGAGEADVRAIEWIDAGGLALARERAERIGLRIRPPEDARVALLFEADLAEAVDEASALEALGAALDAGAAGGPLGALFGILARHASLETLELALPGDEARRRELHRLRESIPETVHEVLAERRIRDPAVRKVGGDAIVPFEDLDEVLPFYHEVFERRGLEHAIWGHVSDGNLHPNALPRSAEEVASAEQAQLEIAREVRRRGGSPLSEHGVGRSPLKQRLLREFYGPEALHEMRAVKRAFDPEWRLAPGVLFPREDEAR
jgi:D-lactate dehydrogenase (cytochrome)